MEKISRYLRLSRFTAWFLPVWILSVWFLSALVLVTALSATQAMHSQTPVRLVGTIVSIGETNINIKSDTGDVRTVAVPSNVPIKRIAPGQKDLSAAEAIVRSDLAIGDRVLVKLSAAKDPVEAIQIIAIKQSDLAAKQQRDRDEWQHHGTGGLVRSVDSATGTIVLTTGAGASTRMITLHIASTTLLKRYAPASVIYDQAKLAPIDAIQVGDQLRARGTQDAASGDWTVAEAISGRFLSLSGTLESIDQSASIITLKDLASHKQITAHISAETQMRRLPEPMAQMIAHRLKSDTARQSSPPAEAAHPPDPIANGGSDGGSGPGLHRPDLHEPDPQQILSQAPGIQLTDLSKGQAVLLVATEGKDGITTITLLAGVEPLLESPAASRNMLSNWSLGSGGAEAGAQ